MTDRQRCSSHYLLLMTYRNEALSTSYERSGGDKLQTLHFVVLLLLTRYYRHRLNSECIEGNNEISMSRCTDMASCCYLRRQPIPLLQRRRNWYLGKLRFVSPIIFSAHTDQYQNNGKGRRHEGQQTQVWKWQRLTICSSTA